MDINEKIIKLLVAAGHVTEEKVEQARHLAETLKWEDENASQQSAHPTPESGGDIASKQHWHNGIYLTHD